MVGNMLEENFKKLLAALQAREQEILLGVGQPLNPYQTSLLKEMKVRWALPYNRNRTSAPMENPSPEDARSFKEQTSSTTVSYKAGKPPIKPPPVVGSEVRASYSDGELLGGRGGIRTRCIVMAGGSEAKQISSDAFL